MVARQNPDLYQLSGGGLHVTYATTGIAGQPSFAYQDGTQSRTFEGSDQIKSEETEIGTFVTVALHITPDSGSTSFSLLVPKVALPDPGGQAISTVGITTVHRTSLIGAPVGQDELYQTTQLDGTASLVMF